MYTELRKLYSGNSVILPAAGAIGGMAAGAYLGNKAQAKIEGQLAKRKFNPNKEADKLDAKSDEMKKVIDKLRSDKSYMKRLDKAIKDRESHYIRRLRRIGMSH